MAGWGGRLFRVLLIILKIFAFILSEKGNHFKVLSRVTVFFLCFRKIALVAVLRVDCWQKVIGQMWKQRDQLGG